MLSWSRDRMFPRRPRDDVQTFGHYFSTFQFEFALGYAPFYHTWLARVVSVPCQIDFGPTSYVYRVVLFSLKGDTGKSLHSAGCTLFPHVKVGAAHHALCEGISSDKITWGGVETI